MVIIIELIKCGLYNMVQVGAGDGHGEPSLPSNINEEKMIL
jgi:hypothetical protein